PRSFWNRLRQAGCEVLAFGPPSLRRPHAVLFRDHRKLLVADGRTAVIGGLCIGGEWLGAGIAPCWRDTAVLLEGPVARELDRAFIRMWRRAGGRTPTPIDTPTGDAGDVAVRVVDGPPAHARAYRLYQILAAMAGRSLYVTGAYPLAPVSLRRALAAAAPAGGDGRLLGPGRPDAPLPNQPARPPLGALPRPGRRTHGRPRRRRRPAPRPRPVRCAAPEPGRTGTCRGPAPRRRADLRVDRPHAPRQDGRRRRHARTDRVEQPQPLQLHRELRAGRRDPGRC